MTDPSQIKIDTHFHEDYFTHREINKYAKSIYNAIINRSETELLKCLGEGNLLTLSSKLKNGLVHNTVESRQLNLLKILLDHNFGYPNKLLLTSFHFDFEISIFLINRGVKLYSCYPVFLNFSDFKKRAKCLKIILDHFFIFKILKITMSCLKFNEYELLNMIEDNHSKNNRIFMGMCRFSLSCTIRICEKVFVNERQ